MASSQLSEAQGASERASLDPANVVYRQFQGEHELDLVMGLIDNELSEPYSIFTYRYFLRQWPFLCVLAFDPSAAAAAADGGDGRCFGCVVAKMDVHRGRALRGYIGMLTVEKPYRHLGVGSELVRRCIGEMAARGGEEVMLEAEVTNAGALRLYAALGFVRDKRLLRYYLNGNDAFRLKLLLPGRSGEAAGGADVADAAETLEELRIS